MLAPALVRVGEVRMSKQGPCAVGNEGIEMGTPRRHPVAQPPEGEYEGAVVRPTEGTASTSQEIADVIAC